MEEDLKGFNVLFGITQVVGVLLVILVAVMTGHFGGGFAWRSDPGLEFNWHPLLTVIAFVYLYGNSIMIYRALRNMRKYKLKVLHASVHTVVVVLMIIALTAVFDSHNFRVPPIPNLYSLHSWIGIVTVAIFVLQWALGILIFLYPGASMKIRAATMPFHVIIGLVAFVMAIAACLTGLTEKAIFSGNYSDLPPAAVLVNVIGVFLIVFGVLVVYIVTEPKYKRYPRPEDGSLLSTSPAE